MNLQLIIFSFLTCISLSYAQGVEVEQKDLVGKCGFGLPAESLEIREGMGFVYLFKKNKAIYAVMGIADKSDYIDSNEIPLMGENEIQSTKWAKDTKNRLILRADENENSAKHWLNLMKGFTVKVGKPFITNGQIISVLPDIAYPVCMVWEKLD